MEEMGQMTFDINATCAAGAQPEHDRNIKERRREIEKSTDERRDGRE